MLRLAFDFIITWRETRTRPNAYHYQIMVMDFSGLCCLDFYIILFGALGYCLVRALYWHNTMS